MLGSYFELILLVGTLASGVIVLVDRIFFKTNRDEERVIVLSSSTNSSKAHKITLPVVLDYAKSLFPVFMVVLLLRTFVVEPFVVPSGSMLPTIKKGDFIFVNKFAYALSMPVWWKTKLWRISKPKRGDIVVLHYPVNTKVYFIKRVIGIPGDKISYVQKHLYINGRPIQQHVLHYVQVPSNISSIQENLFGVQHSIWIDTVKHDVDFHNLVVPKDQYFVMGDNRDNSEDSRYWGFVPKDYISGKAFIVLFSWDSHKSSVRFRRIGHILR
ncbi:MAG: signal peptidase I [Thiotrichales bacterium]|nr:MAG: signal peptidase I [Thiotrichales bacterium]